MEEGLEDDFGLDPNAQKKVEDGIESLLNEEELKIKWGRELANNVSFQNYLESFSSISVSNFTSTYLQCKYSWYKFGSMYKDQVERNMSKWIDLAHEHLGIILQKKLFDLQCLWRAEEIKIEGVEICFDFQMWERNILNCPFIELISEEEIVLYQEYLLNGDIDDHEYFDRHDWQDYSEMKENYQNHNSESDLPPWYQFHNLRTGNSKLFLLADIRGDKEFFYIDLGRSERIKIAPAVTTPAVYDNRPFISAYNPEQMDFVVKTFENRQIQQGYYYYTEAKKNRENVEHYEDLLQEMLDSEEPVPIKEHSDFRVALQIAYKEYKSKKISEHLPVAFKQYLLYKQMGFETGETDSDFRDLRDRYGDFILDGREANGEPRDFDF